MQAITLERTEFAHVVVVSLATLAAIALLSLVLSYWTWTWLAPRPELRAPAAAQNAGPIEAAYSLFAEAPGATAAAPTGVSVTLLGVVATADSRAGYALLRFDAKETIALRAGGEIEPGLRLVEVHVDHVVIERSGTRQTLALPEPGQSAATPAPLAGN